MAIFNSLKQVRSTLLQTATVTTTAAVDDAALHHHHRARSNSRSIAGRLPAYGPMWFVFGIMGGMVGVAGIIGGLTAKQQLVNSPSVQVSKKKRRSFPEVDNPDAVLNSADKFINKSFLRKVAHIQDNKHAHNDPTRPDPFTRSRNIETLKSVGVRT